MQIQIGNIIPTKAMIFKSFNLNLGTAQMVYPVDGGSPILVQLPLTLVEFGLGMYGANSWIHPTDLPPSHPNFCLWKDEKRSIVTHNRTGEQCYLLLGKGFHVSGEFKLTPVSGGEGEFKTSTIHTPATAKRKLDELIGREMIFNTRILSILIDDVIESSMLLTRFNLEKRHISLVFSSIKWLCLAALPINLMDTSPKEPSKHKREKWKKKKKQSSQSNT